MTTLLLEHVDTVFITFANGTYQWVDITRFRPPAEACEDRCLLGLLIAHDLYGDNHAGGEPGTDPTRHGPYWRDRITPDHFDPDAAATAEPQLRTWAEQYAQLREDTRAELERELYAPLRDATTVYRLRDLGTDAFHDWGGVHDEFHELVLIDRTANLLTLVVAADD
ncbi:hypothetical protein R8Z50_23010 [Longispora sp. K20-0274]|uniref:hypothetical protein n=1 Tax=Longispora sp. K20-0274 TaxID=3088255 RepID=UPI0039999D43